MQIILQNMVNATHTPDIQTLQQWVDTALAYVNFDDYDIDEMTIRITSANESAELNQTYRQKTGPTNILSFTYDPIPGETPDSLGDLVVCAELVATEAKQQHKEIQNHWAHLIVHGTLHLLGYDHQNDEDALLMEQLERDILEKLAIADPYHDLD